jgi:peptidoglycan L-alanyl-D-glutamate endopeptidase CwlK
MASPLGPKSMDKLKGVHPDLVRVVKRAIFLSEVDFIVTEGLRSVDKQARLVKAGASKTMNSRHLTGHAIDVAPVINGEVSWAWPPFHTIAKAMKQAAA